MKSVKEPWQLSAWLGSLKHAAVLCGMLFGFQATQAAVIYYKPPQRLVLHNFNGSHHDYNIDLNDDGVVDLQHDAGGGSAYLRALEETRFLGLRLPYQHVTWYDSQPYALAASTLIGPDSPSLFPEYGSLSGWQAHPVGVPGVASLHVRYDVGTSGFFVGTSGYIGVEFLIDGQVHYGWIHLGNYTWWQSEIHGWAYESEPGKPILAGAIPEPSTTGAAAVAVVSLLLRRRRLHGPFDHPR
jgi:hypothetical protein